MQVPISPVILENRKELMDMKQFVPRDKMSKRQKKTLDKQKRAIWSIKPTTKIVKSKKVYDRKKQPRNYEPYDSEAVAICFI